MTMYTEEQVKEMISRAREDDLRRIQALIADREEEHYRRSIAEWALVGVASQRADVQISETLLASRGVRLAEVLRHVSHNVACSMLDRGARAFNQHARLAALVEHIHYLEGWLAANGLNFRRMTDLPGVANNETPPSHLFPGPFDK